MRKGLKKVPKHCLLHTTLVSLPWLMGPPHLWLKPNIKEKSEDLSSEPCHMECLHTSWQGWSGQTPEMHSSHCKWTWKIQCHYSSLKWDQASRRGQTLWLRHRLHLLLKWTWTWRKTWGWHWLCCKVNACWQVGWPPPKGVNDCLMMMRLPFSNGLKFITIVSTYAPTMTNQDEVKDKFYEDLNAIITTIPSTDKIIISGD